MIASLLVMLQSVCGLRVLARLLARPGTLTVARSDQPQPERVSVVLPVLNEAERLPRCLDGLIAQPEEVSEILVVDGGSCDGTRAMIEQYQRRDSRVKLVNAIPVDRRWTGKAWGLHVGLAQSSEQSDFILCVDADAHADPALVRSLLAHARRTGDAAFSIATRQRLPGLLDGMIHPALLSTLVYRFGIPGSATRDRHRVQANGQCFLSRRATLARTGAIRAAQSSLCEDMTIARRIAECGESVGFYESDGLIDVEMYTGWRETWCNWPRSLPMRDQYFGWREAAAIGDVLLVQALPLPLLLGAWLWPLASWLFATNAAFVVLRLGVLHGMARAYPNRPWSYWVSPICDLPAALKLIESTFRRRHHWRGRTYLRRQGGIFEAVEDKN